MTATDELRRLLDERGVEWDGESYESCTFWNEEKNLAVASEDIDGKLWVSQSITPEQAIAATLGSERERELELLVKQLWYLVNHRSGYGYAAALESIEELGIEVER
jgi:hypothetical protein